MLRLAVILTLAAAPAQADVVAAAVNLRPGTILSMADLAVIEGAVPDGYEQAEDLVGMQVRMAIRKGAVVLSSQIGMAALVERNAEVTLYYYHNGISMVSTGRALSPAGVGEAIRVMNLVSKKTLTGVLQPDGSVLVDGSLLPPA